MPTYEQFTVIIPTLNEQGTIGTLIRRLLKLYRGVRILVVDDGSKDRTKRIVMALAARSRAIRMLDRKAAGLRPGLTYSMMDGVRHARTRYVIFIDGDMQHPPEVIGRLAEHLGRGSTIAVAVRGGNYNPVLHRRVVSTTFTYMGMAVLLARGSASSSDIMSGYFGVERTFAERLINKNQRRFVGHGYKFLFDLLKCIPRGTARISEVEYTFRERQFGSSKAGMRHGIALLRSYTS